MTGPIGDHEPPSTGRLIAFDLGEVRVGVATSDPGQIIASAAETVEVPREAGERNVARRLAEVVERYGAVAAVVGLPRTLEGREGRAARRCRLIAEELAARTSLPVVLWDERFTTTEAERVMIEQGTRRRARRQAVDRVAAAFILQGYLDSRRGPAATER